MSEMIFNSISAILESVEAKIIIAVSAGIVVYYLYTTRSPRQGRPVQRRYRTRSIHTLWRNSVPAIESRGSSAVSLVSSEESLSSTEGSNFSSDYKLNKFQTILEEDESQESQDDSVGTSRSQIQISSAKGKLNVRRKSKPVRRGGRTTR